MRATVSVADSLLENAKELAEERGVILSEVIKDALRDHLSRSSPADASHAALAMENGCEWVTADTDSARLAPALRWRHL